MTFRIVLTACALLFACGPARPRGDETCTPDCDGLACGDDGCGGSCGACPAALPRCAAGACRTACTPSCDGRQCGDDGCDGRCGNCVSTMQCTTLGLCAATSDGCAKGCPAANYCDTDTDTCRPGCLDDTNCGLHQQCDPFTHACGAKAEACNGEDDDGDGRVDEDFPTKGQPCDGSDADKCESGEFACTPDGRGVACQGDTNHNELCNGRDDDCDGRVDEDFVGLGEPCDGPDGDRCANGHFACSADGRGVSCDGDASRAEICNGLDDDCDGQVDTAKTVTSITLAGATGPMAAEFTTDGLLLVARTAAGARIYAGPWGAVVARDEAANGWPSAAAVAGGKAAVLFSQSGAKVWWGAPGAMRTDSVPDLYTIGEVSGDLGGTVGLFGGGPVVLRVAQGPGDSDFMKVVERVGYVWSGTAFQGTSLAKHTYFGGNTDNGGVVEVTGGRALAFVRDEWNNNFYQGIDVRCAWFSYKAGAWTTGDAGRLCDPVGAPVALGGKAYAVSKPWSGNPDALQSTTDGRNVTRAQPGLPSGTNRVQLVSDGARLHYVWVDPTSGALQEKLTSGGATRTLGATLGDSGAFLAGAIGDELYALTWTWTSEGLTDVKLLRQLSCH